jgi:uncharacterized protein YodC (DUF2158 family)
MILVYLLKKKLINKQDMNQKFEVNNKVKLKNENSIMEIVKPLYENSIYNPRIIEFVGNYLCKWKNGNEEERTDKFYQEDLELIES